MRKILKDLLTGVQTSQRQDLETPLDNPILNKLGLSNCRITQTEEEHIKEWNWSMFAYDIACIRWKSFEVYALNFKDSYTIKKVWYDSIIWNHVVISNGDISIVYAHTISEFKEGDEIKSWQVLGYTDISWVSQNYHLHIELWKGDENISWSYVFGNWIFRNSKSEKLILQRSTTKEVVKFETIISRDIDQKAFDFIVWWEGNVQLKAFCDDYYKVDWKLIRKAWKDCWRWAIWYWTLSYRWEVITEEEAERRMKEYLGNIIEKIPSCWTENQRLAILDYQYQFGTYSKDINIYSARCSYKDVAYILYPYNRYLSWVEKRRIRWYNKFNS